MSIFQPRHGECLYYADGICLATGARVKAEEPACPMFTPKIMPYTAPTYPYTYPYAPYMLYIYPYMTYVYPWVPLMPPIAYWWPLPGWPAAWLWPWWLW